MVFVSVGVLWWFNLFVKIFVLLRFVKILMILRLLVNVFVFVSSVGDLFINFNNLIIIGNCFLLVIGSIWELVVFRLILSFLLIVE